MRNESGIWDKQVGNSNVACRTNSTKGRGGKPTKTLQEYDPLGRSANHWMRPQKKRREMPIHFPNILEPILRELCATKSGKRGEDGYVLDVGERAFYSRFAKMKSSLGIRPEVIPYSSRHSTGSELSLMGVPPAVIIEIMRHKNYTTTLRHYTKLPSDLLISTLNKMAEGDSNGVSSVCQ